jgi:YbbR domain-containing protein
VLLPQGTTLAGTPPSTVTVRLRGPEPLLRRTDAYDLDVRIDLRDSATGERTVQLTPKNISGVPRDLEVTMIDPERLKLVVAKKSKREIPVAPTIVGKPPQGYAVYGATPRPEQLEVEGPQAKVAAAPRLRTDPIDVDGRREPFTVRVGALPEGPDVRVVDSRPLDVTVYVDLAPVEATLERVPVVVPTEDAVAVPSTVAVRIAAPPGLLSRIKEGHVRAVADLPTVPEGAIVHNVPLRVEFPGLDPDERAKVSVKAVSRRNVEIRERRR